MFLVACGTRAHHYADPGCRSITTRGKDATPLVASTTESRYLGDLDVEPATTRTLTVLTLTDRRPTALIGCVRWELLDSTWATIDKATNRISIAAGAPHDATVRVRAHVAGTQPATEVLLRVTDRSKNPLVGSWRVLPESTCGGTGLLNDEERMGDLRFQGDGTFSVAWMPFEFYRDYWGTYEIGDSAPSIVLKIGGGNYVPAQLKLAGTFEAARDGRLILRSLWLGSRSDSLKASRPCDYVLERH
jgi:hypothetical protein